MNDIIKIGYFADGPWAHGALDLLLDDPSIVVNFICARYSRPDPFLREKAAQIGIDFLIDKDVNSPSCVERFSRYQADLFVSMSFDQILRKRVYGLPRMGTINCHAGKLPFYRGRNVLNWVLINDEKEFGITVHYIDDGIDTGDIIAQATFPITDDDNYGTLLEKAFRECPKLLYLAIKDLHCGGFQRTPQSQLSSVGLICSQRIPGDEHLDWNTSSRDVFNFVRALSHPGVGAETALDGFPVKINKIELVPGAPIYKGISGSILAKDGNSFLVKTGDSYVKVIEWSSTVRLRAGARFK